MEKSDYKKQPEAFCQEMGKTFQKILEECFGDYHLALREFQRQERKYGHPIRGLGAPDERRNPYS